MAGKVRAFLQGVGSLMNIYPGPEAFEELRLKGSKAAESFIAATDDESVEEWESARKEVRAGTTPAECADLGRETEALPAEISVERLEPSKASPTLHPEPRAAVALAA